MLTKKPFGDIITFTRASSGGRFNAQGVYEMVPANQPRIDYDPVTGECNGILIEEQRVNLFTESEFRNGVVDCPTKSALVTAAAMQGFAGALHIGYNGGNLQVAYKTNATLTASSVATISAVVQMDDGGAPVFGATAAEPLSDFAFVMGSDPFVPNFVQHIGGGRYLVAATATVGTTNLSGNGVIKYATNSPRTFKVTAYQLEAGPFSTSYIPTTTAQVTRATDVALINTLSPWWNSVEGTLFAEVSSKWGNDNRDHQIIGLVGADARQVLARFSGGSLQVHDGTSFRTLPNALFNTPGSRKVAISYKNGETSSPAAVGGASGVYTSDGNVVGNATAIRIGSAPSGSNVWNGHIKSIRFYPKQKDQAGNASLTA